MKLKHIQTLLEYFE